MAFAVLFALLAASGASASASGVPSLTVAEIIREWAPTELAATMLRDPAARAGILGLFADEIEDMGRDAIGSQQLGYIVAAGRAYGTHLGRRGGPWSQADIDAWLSVLLVDSTRFVTNAEFQAVIRTTLPRAVTSLLPSPLRQSILRALNRTPGIDFELSERLELAAGEARRDSAAHELTFASDDIRVDHDGQIVTSLFSLPSTYYRPEEVGPFLEALAEYAPEREVLVLADAGVRDHLEAELGDHIHLLNTHGRTYSPWVRDPVLLARASDGSVVVMQRPYQQAGREQDSYLGREIIQQLPDDVAEVWTGVSWIQAEVPFHNGQILVVGDTVWISLHTLGRAIQEAMGGRGVPTGALGDPAVLEHIVDVVRDAARDLEDLYGKRVRFVHDLPDRGPAGSRASLMQTLVGGGGYDLDSVVSLLPGDDGEAAVALVADVSLGSDLLGDVSLAELDGLRRGYGLGAAGEALRSQLLAYQAGQRVQALQGFLDVVAEDLAGDGLDVVRIPLLAVPTTALADRGLIQHENFLVNWNNVVLETAPGVARAEGFGSLLPTGDAAATAAFAAAGYDLTLLPPLVTSVIRNGGYRCSSNHLTARESLPVSAAADE